MIVLAGGDLVLPDRILSRASLVIDGSRIAAVEPQGRPDSPGAAVIDASACYVVPGFVDVHVHGVEGHDTLDERDAIARIALRLPQYGVTAFCPTTVACPPEEMRGVLAQVAACRASRPRGAARVLPAHLESNFINPNYAGAQPASCLRLPGSDRRAGRGGRHAGEERRAGARRDGRVDRDSDGEFSAGDVLDAITAGRADVGIVTLAPELPGGLDLVQTLAAAGLRVSVGHSGADLDQANAAIAAGARHATHLFNRMTPMTQRAPGLAGAVLASPAIAAELICDGYHVHPTMSRIAIAAKGVDRVMAITDGTGGSGLPVGATARLGGRPIRVTDQAAVLEDGTLAGSTLTMDRAFRTIVAVFGLPVTDAALLCATTPAREMGLTGFGVLARDAVADVVVLDRGFRVVRTFIDGEEVYAREDDRIGRPTS